MEDIAFSFAADTTKEIIAFSTAIITITATFAKDTFLADRKSLPKSLGISWLFYLFCIACGGWTLLALTGELASSDPDDRTIWELNVTLPATLMCISFFAGLVLTAVASWRSLGKLLSKVQPNNELNNDAQ